MIDFFSFKKGVDDIMIKNNQTRNVFSIFSNEKKTSK